MLKIMGKDLCGSECKSAVYDGGHILFMPSIPMQRKELSADDLARCKSQAEIAVGDTIEGAIFAISMGTTYAQRLALRQNASKIGLEKSRFFTASVAMLIAWYSDHLEEDEYVLWIWEIGEPEVALVDCGDGVINVDQLGYLDFEQGRFIPLDSAWEIAKTTGQIINRSGIFGGGVKNIIAASREMNLAAKVRNYLWKKHMPKIEEMPDTAAVKGAAIYGAKMGGDLHNEILVLDATAYEFSLRLGREETVLSSVGGNDNIPNCMSFNFSYKSEPIEIEFLASTRSIFGAKNRELYNLGSLTASMRGKEVIFKSSIDENGFVTLTAEDSTGFRQEFIPNLSNLIRAFLNP